MCWQIVLPLFLLDPILPLHVVLTRIQSPLVPPAWRVVAHSLPLFLLDPILPSHVVLTLVPAPLVAHAWYAVAHSLPLFLLDPDVFFFDYQHSLSDAILLDHHEDSCHLDLWIAASIYLVSSVVK
jgi:hypothetical protein